MRVVLADDGMIFDAQTPRERPLGGAESAFVALAQALAAAGAHVSALARGARAFADLGVEWRDVRGPWPEAADLLIINRAPHLLTRPIRARRRVFWLHNPAGFLSKPRYLTALALARPTLVFAGPHHASTAPSWLGQWSRRIIPLGVETAFLETQRRPGAPPPVALFTSNPLRGLVALCGLWRTRIHPAAPEAELHVHAGPEVYGGGARAAEMEAALAVARSLEGVGVRVRAPLPKAELAATFAQARAMTYLGDPGETFCLALAEAQAMGLPCVVKPAGAVAERVRDGETGFVAADDESFAARAVSLLRDDALWARQSAAALAQRADMTWARAAAAFLAI